MAIEHPIDETGSGGVDIYHKSDKANNASDPAYVLNGYYMHHTMYEYIVDLDRMAFVVDHNVHFRLDKIPRGPDNLDWTKFITRDGCVQRCRAPTTPTGLLADIHTNMDDVITPKAVAAYGQITPKPQIIDALDLLPRPAQRFASQDVSMFAVIGIFEDTYGILSTIQKFRSDHAFFQIVAKSILVAAAPRAIRPLERDTLTTSGAVELVADFSGALRLRAQLEGVRMAQAGRNLWDDGVEAAELRDPVFYWFRGCLVGVAFRLDDDEHLRAWVGMAVERIRTRGKGVGHEGAVRALLWSVRHVVVVTVSDVCVSHTRAVPIVDAYRADDEAFKMAISLLMHHLQPSYIDGCSALPSKPRNQIPLDVAIRIFDYTDKETYDVCRTLTKALRREWLEHPRISVLKLFKPMIAAVDCDDLDTSKFPHAVFTRARLANNPDDVAQDYALLHTGRDIDDLTQREGLEIQMYTSIAESGLLLPTQFLESEEYSPLINVNQSFGGALKDYFIPANNVGKLCGTGFIDGEDEDGARDYPPAPYYYFRCRLGAPPPVYIMI